jgi:hypothetical protein
VEALRVVSVSLTGEVLWSVEEALVDHSPARCRQVARLVVLAHASWPRSVVVSPLHRPARRVDEATGTVRRAQPGWRNVGFLPLITRALAEAGGHQSRCTCRTSDTAALSEYEFAEARWWIR